MFQGRGDTHGFQMTLQIFEVFFSFSIYLLFLFSFAIMRHKHIYNCLFLFLFFWWGERGRRGMTIENTPCVDRSVESKPRNGSSCRLLYIFLPQEHVHGSRTLTFTSTKLSLQLTKYAHFNKRIYGFIYK